MPYGHNLIGELYPSPEEPELCAEIMFEPEPSFPNNDNNFDNSRKSKVFYFAKRGKCTFAQKAWNAQVQGASALLIADNREEDVSRIVPSKKGNDYNPQIPVFLINKKDAEKISKALEKNSENLANSHSKVVMSLAFPLQKKPKVDLKIKIGLENFTVVENLIGILKFVELLGNKVNVITVFDVDYLNNTQQGKLCMKVGDGKVCSEESTGKYFSLILDLENSVLFEMVKQMYLQSSTSLKNWRIYLEKFKEFCYEDYDEEGIRKLKSGLKECTKNAIGSLENSELYQENFLAARKSENLKDYVLKNSDLSEKFMFLTPSMMVNHQILKVN